MFLYGYLTAGNKISLVSSSGRVLEVIDDYTIRLEPNAYTPPPGFVRPGAPATDAASFEQSVVKFDAKLPLQLLDQYGTPYSLTANLVSVDVANDYLEFDDTQFAGAIPGDVIVIADATIVEAAFDAGLAAMWDAFQADGLGEVVGSVDLSYPWMV